jgi:hypothetical protein
MVAHAMSFKVAPSLLLASLLLTGCISYQSDSTHSKHHFSEVHSGETTITWLLDHFGSPESVNETASGSEVWHYEMEEKEDTDVSLFIIFDFSNSTSRTRNFFFEVDEGIVTKAWRS